MWQKHLIGNREGLKDFSVICRRLLMETSQRRDYCSKTIWNIKSYRHREERTRRQSFSRIIYVCTGWSVLIFFTLPSLIKTVISCDFGSSVIIWTTKLLKQFLMLSSLFHKLSNSFYIAWFNSGFSMFIHSLVSLIPILWFLPILVAYTAIISRR